jgi:mRNA interferase MazF
VSDEYIKDFGGWHQRVSSLDLKEFEDFFYEREIWWCALGVNIGSEQDGKNESFERPVLILKKISKDLLWVAPLTSKIVKHDFRVLTKSTGEPSQVLLSQIRTISSKRLLRKIGKMKRSLFSEIIIKLALILLEVSQQNETPP